MSESAFLFQATSLLKLPAFRHCGDIAGAVDDAHDYDCGFGWPIIDRVGIVERHAQAQRELLARWTG
jgi:hypothetical protein